MERRVVITGLGTLNPVARSVPETWEKLLQGKSGITRLVKARDSETYTSRVAGQIINLDYSPAFKNVQKAKRLDTFVHYAGWAMKEERPQVFRR